MPYQDDDELSDTFLNEDEEEGEEDEESDSKDDGLLEPEKPEAEDWEEE